MAQFSQASPTRRRFLQGVTAMGCSTFAHPLMTSVVFADAPWDNRLVVVLLRGAMDGLDVVRPSGDPLFQQMRPGLMQPGVPGLDLDGYFTLNPGLGALMPLWQAGDLGFVQAVSTPYRDKRSHFDGQDLLETGTAPDVTGPTRRDGWLNRMLQTVPGVSSETAFAIGAGNPLLLSGAAPVSNWAPNATLRLPENSQRLLTEIYHDDPLFRDAAAQAIALSEQMAEEADANMAGAQGLEKGEGPEVALARFAAQRLNRDTRIAAFSVNGWDTHRDQAARLPRRLSQLADVILALRGGLGDNWRKTTVLAMTEFGRTARQNGTGGTDHGTGGLMILAGGAVRGGQVHGPWPGIAEAELYARRDLMPTSDVRAHAAWALRVLFGIDRATLEGMIFPGLDMGENSGLLL